jgi:shikimate dehydrogenase
MDKIFVDLDDVIAQRIGAPVSKYIQQFGEDAFRELESQVILEYGKKSGQVIATGGGCVTGEKNYLPLHQNGNIYWLHRDLSLLPTEGRPLSQNGKLEAMYEIRKPMYERFSDFNVDNHSSIESVVHDIMKHEGCI